MNLTGKQFKNKSGKIVVVKESNENITTFEDNSKVETRYILDTRYFVELPMIQPQQNINFKQMEKIDPKDFFNQRNPLLEQISSLSNEIVNKMKDDPNIVTPSHQRDFYPTDNSSAVVQYDPELEKEEIARKYNISTQHENINKQANAFLSNPRLAKILEEEGEIASQPQITQESRPYTPSQESHVYAEENRASSVQIESVMEQKINLVDSYIDPIISMFKKAKRNTDFKISFDVSNKIPRLDFIEMMEDSYETSIIDFLAQEFTNQLLSNPSVIKEKIKEGINKMLEKNNKPKAIKEEIKEVPIKKTATKKAVIKKQ